MEFSRQEYWSRLIFPSLANLPNPGISARGCKRVRLNWTTKQQQNLGVEIFLWAPAFNFFKCILISETAGSHSNSIVNVLGNLYMLSIEVALIYIPTNSIQSFSLCHILATLTFFFFLLDNEHTKRCKVVSHCGFDLYFPDSQCWLVMWSIFYISVSHLYWHFFEEMSFRAFAHF